MSVAFSDLGIMNQFSLSVPRIWLVSLPFLLGRSLPST
jgi:hypothetical protein